MQQIDDLFIAARCRNVGRNVHFAHNRHIRIARRLCEKPLFMRVFFLKGQTKSRAGLRQLHNRYIRIMCELNSYMRFNFLGKS